MPRNDDEPQTAPAGTTLAQGGDGATRADGVDTPSGGENSPRANSSGNPSPTPSPLPNPDVNDPRANAAKNERATALDPETIGTTVPHGIGDPAPREGSERSPATTGDDGGPPARRIDEQVENPEESVDELRRREELRADAELPEEQAEGRRSAALPGDRQPRGRRSGTQPDGERRRVEVQASAQQEAASASDSLVITRLGHYHPGDSGDPERAKCYAALVTGVSDDKSRVEVQIQARDRYTAIPGTGAGKGEAFHATSVPVGKPGENASFHLSRSCPWGR